jgi:hypothetical protein
MKIFKWFSPKQKPTELEIAAQKLREYYHQYMEFTRMVYALPEGEFKTQAMLVVDLMRKNFDACDELFKQRVRLNEQVHVIKAAEKMIRNQPVLCK